MKNQIAQPICHKCKRKFPDILRHGQYVHQFCLTGLGIFAGNKLLRGKRDGENTKR